jgi:hypothetical protein
LNFSTKNYDSNLSSKDKTKDSSGILSSQLSRKSDMFTKVSNTKNTTTSINLSKSTNLKSSIKNRNEYSTNNRLKEIIQNFTGFSKNKIF